MIIFLYGPDSYRRDIKKRFYVSEFGKKYSIHGIEHVDLSAGGGLQTLDLAARSRSLFEPAKLISADNFPDITPKKLKDALKPFLEDKQLNVLLVADKKPAKSLDFLLKKPATSLFFEQLEGAAWMKFVHAEVAANKVNLEPAALDLLARTYEKNSWGLVTELQKLSGSSKALTVSDLVALGVEIAPEFFPLAQSLRATDMSQRFAALARLLSRNEPPAKIFNIVSALWVQKTPQFAAYDLAIKMGKMDYEEALTDLITT